MSGGCLRRGAEWEAGAHEHSQDSLERSPVAEGILGLAFLVTILLAMYGLWAGMRALFSLIR